MTRVPVRVVVAEDHPLYRDGIVDALKRRTDMSLLAACSDGDDALEQVLAHAPDVALLDLMMPGASAVRVLQEIVAHSLPTRVLVLSAFAEPEAVRSVIEAGASGYISKDAARDEICNAILSVARGKTVLDQPAQAALTEQLRSHRQQARAFLSDRELEVLKLLADGLSTRQIADQLILGIPTIKTHQRNLYQKLGVSGQAAAVAEAMRRELLH